MTLSVLQSSYIPWKGYFALIGASDLCIMYDTAQFTRRDWRNRNLIKTPAGVKWLTIPVSSRGKYTQRICDTEVTDQKWADRHLKALQLNYSSAPFFGDYYSRVAEAYREASEMKMLSDINYHFIRFVCDILSVETRIGKWWEYEKEGSGSDAILSLCERTGADEYLSGPSGINYLDISKFEAKGIKVRFADYSEMPVYGQPWPPFVHGVTVLDLLFCTGSSAGSFIKIG